MIAFRVICAFGAVSFFFNGFDIVPIVWAVSPLDGFGTAIAFAYCSFVLALNALGLAE